MADLNLIVNESITTAEQVEVQAPGDIFVSESISVADTVIANKMGDIKASESIQVAEKVTVYITGADTMLRITQDDETLVSLNVPPYFLLEFSSEAPILRSQRLASSLEDGENVLYSRYNNVVQPIRVLVGGNSTEDVQQAIESLEEVCSRVANSFSIESAPVMLGYKPRNATHLWESPIITATLISEFNRVQEPSERVLTPVSSYTRYSIVTLNIERAFYWQRPLTYAAMSNQHDTGWMGTIYNHDDSVHDNWVDIAENEIEGALPTPARILLLNREMYENLTNYMLSLNACSDPELFNHIIEGEDATWKAGGSSVVNSSKYSSGSALKVRPENVPGSETCCASWNLSEALLASAGSRWFHILMYTIESVGLAEDDLIQLRINANGVEITNTPWRPYGMSKEGFIMDCGALRLPPFAIRDVPPQALTLELYVKSDASVVFYLDFFQLSPASTPDGFINVVPYDHSISYDSFMIHDGPREAVYEGTAAGYAGAWFTPEGKYIYLQPAVKQRLIFLINNVNGDVPITIRNFVFVGYHPRRLRV